MIFAAITIFIVAVCGWMLWEVTKKKGEVKLEHRPEEVVLEGASVSFDKAFREVGFEPSQREKAKKIILELAKQEAQKEIEKIQRRKEEKALASAFNEAAQDRERLAVSDEWNILDREEWD